MSKKRRRLVALAVRDGCVCHLCGLPVNMLLRAPHPMSPTQDHLIPKSTGGPRNLNNKRLAHRICNQRRGTAPVRVVVPDLILPP